MAQAILGFLGGGGFQSIVQPLEQLGQDLIVWLRRMFMSIWRFILSMFRRLLDLFMKDPIAFATFIAELAVFFL